MALTLAASIANAKNKLFDNEPWLPLLEIDVPALDEPLKLVRNTEDISWPEEVQDLTDYTETDPNARFTVIADKITVNGLTRNEDAYVYYDFGVGNTYFDGSYEIWTTVKITAADAWGYLFLDSLTNLVNDFKGIDTANGDALSIRISNVGGVYYIHLYELDGGTVYTDVYVCSVDTTYYLRFVRDETDDTDYGTLYCYIYSDAARKILLDTLTLTLHTSKKNFRYLYGAQSFNNANAAAMSAEISDLEIYNRWQKFPYDLAESKQASDGSIQTLQARVANVLRQVESYINDADGGYGSEVIIRVVYNGDLTLTDAVLEERFDVGKVSFDNIWGAFELIPDSFFTNRFPKDTFSRVSCRHDFKSRECGYTGSETECNRTMDDCIARSNEANFGACPAIPGGSFNEDDPAVIYAST